MRTLGGACAMSLLLAALAWGNTACEDPLWAQNGPRMAQQCGWCPPVCQVSPGDIAQTCGEACRATCDQHQEQSCPACPPATVALVQTVIPIGKATRCRTKKGNPLLQVCRGTVLIRTTQAPTN